MDWAGAGMGAGAAMSFEMISLEVTNRCDKACWFCYNGSRPDRDTCWSVGEIIAFARDCAAGGVKAISFGGGEPLQFDRLLEVLEGLRGVMFRSVTTNGLLLDDGMIGALREVAVEKVHVSIHFPERDEEVERVIRQAGELQAAGIRSGINFVVGRSKLEAARRAAARVREAGIGNDRIIYLPMRKHDEPTPEEVKDVAGAKNFQSATCLMGCASSARFVSIDWKKEAAWCSYTETRRLIEPLTHRGLVRAMDGLGLKYCGTKETSGAIVA